MRKSSAADVDVELLKAVAQAWHAQSGNPQPSSRASADDGASDGAASGARRRGGCRGPSRFKLEAEAAAAAAAAASRRRSWDFAQSLWDTYELVAVAQKLESSLVIADQQAHAAPPRPGSAAGDEEGAGRGRGGGGKRARESSRSLRSLFLRSSSRRLDEPRS